MPDAPGTLADTSVGNHWVALDGVVTLAILREGVTPGLPDAWCVTGTLDYPACESGYGAEDECSGSQLCLQQGYGDGSWAYSCEGHLAEDSYLVRIAPEAALWLAHQIDSEERCPVCDAYLGTPGDATTCPLRGSDNPYVPQH